MPTTPINALRYPATSSAPNIPQDIQNLATDVDGKLPRVPTGQIQLFGNAPTADKPMIVKAYTVVVTTNSGGNATHTFPGGAFPNAVSSVVVCSGDPVAGNHATATAVVTSSTATINTRHFQPSGAVCASVSVRINVVAVGW